MSYICTNAASVCIESSTIQTNQNVTVYWPANQIPLISTMDLTLHIYSGNLNSMLIIDPCEIPLTALQSFQLSQNSDTRLGSQAIVVTETEAITQAIQSKNEFFMQLVVPYPRLCMLGPWVTKVFKMVSSPSVSTNDPVKVTPTETPVPEPGNSLATHWIVIIVLACLLLLALVGLAFWRYYANHTQNRNKLASKDPTDAEEEYGIDTIEVKEEETPKLIEIPSNQEIQEIRPDFWSMDRSLKHSPSYSHFSAMEQRSLRYTPSLSHLETSTVDIPISEDAVYRAIDTDKETIEQGLETLSRGLRRLDQGLKQLDIGLCKLDELSKSDRPSSAQLIAHAFREQLTNPPEGWERRSVDSIRPMDSFQ